MFNVGSTPGRAPAPGSPGGMVSPTHYLRVFKSDPMEDDALKAANSPLFGVVNDSILNSVWGTSLVGASAGTGTSPLN